MTDKPSIIKVRTAIGYGSHQEGTGEAHGTPLGAESLAAAKRKFGFDPEKTFHIDKEVRFKVNLEYYKQFNNTLLCFLSEFFNNLRSSESPSHL